MNEKFHEFVTRQGSYQWIFLTKYINSEIYVTHFCELERDSHLELSSILSCSNERKRRTSDPMIARVG